MSKNLARGLRLCAAVAVVLAASGCPKNVGQDSKSGKDFRSKGARTIRVEDNEGRSRDIVTYPGGDRIDWKVFEASGERAGTLRVKLLFRPPRPKHDVAFEVFDQYFIKLDRVKPSLDKRVKQVKIPNAAPGKYYVMVYAPRRKDAGEYILSVRFKENPPMTAVVTSAVPIPDPPRLPAIPEAEIPPVAGPPTTPDPPPLARPDPIAARVVGWQVTSNGSLILTLDKGKSAGVEPGWEGQVLAGKSGRALEGGDFKITKVTSKESVGKVRLSADQITNNRGVSLQAPP